LPEKSGESEKKRIFSEKFTRFWFFRLAFGEFYAIFVAYEREKPGKPKPTTKPQGELK